jgi:VWFA-related protein
MRRVVGLVLLLLGVLPLSVASRQVVPQGTPSFKAGVELLVLDVSVLDDKRQPVGGLTAGDFTILEDGKPQVIASFSAVDLPDVVTERTEAAPWVRTVAPDVQRNTDIKDRRIVVIVMDDATPMPAPEVILARASARQVVDALGPNDLASVVYALNRRSGQEFTADRARLLAAVDRFSGAIEGGGVDEKGVWWPFMPFDKYNVASTGLYQSTLRLIQGLADDLAALPERRKALVFVSVGLPIDGVGVDASTASSGNVGGAEGLRDVWQAVHASLDAARRANVTIYGLDPGGLRAPGTVITPAARPDVAAPSPSGVNTADPSGLHPGRPNQDFLKTVSENTGGFAITDTNGPAPQIRQLLKENGSYYLLGYAPSNTRAQGRYRRIEVKVNRPGVIVRTRQGYFEAKPAATKKAAGSPPDTSGVALGVLPKIDLPLSLAVAPFALPGQRNAALTIVVRVEEPAPKQAALINEDVEIRVAAYAPTGDRRGQVNRVFPVTIKTGGRAGVLRFDLPLRLDLPPGRYHLRVSAERKPGKRDIEVAGGREGSVYTDVDVPDFAKETLALSGVVMTTPLSRGSASLEALAAILPAMPTTTREFGQEDLVTGFLRAYQGGDGPLVPVDPAVSLEDVTGASVIVSSETLGAERFGKSRAADVRFDVPLATLSPGPYLLQIQAVAGKVTRTRAIRLTVKNRQM